MGLRTNKFPKVKIDPKIPDYGDHPYFVNKTEHAKKFMENAGIPQDLSKLRNHRLKK